jgi:hypothetical protein
MLTCAPIPDPMILYHRTPAADAILRYGFRDSAGDYGTEIETAGVWFSDHPLGIMEGAAGDTVLAVEIPDRLT